MKKTFIALLCLLLCGCTPKSSPDAPPDQTANEPPVLSAVPEDLKDRFPDDLKIQPLSQRKVRGMLSMEDDFLLFSGHGATTITLLSGDTYEALASLTLDFELNPEDPSVQVHRGSLSYFDPSAKEIVLLDNSLQTIRRIPAPKDMLGAPLLSADTKTVYYCTFHAIRSWDLESNIRRRIKEISCDAVFLSGLHLNDTVLEYRIPSEEDPQVLFMAVDNGKLLKSLKGNITMVSAQDRYYAVIPDSNLYTLVYGQGEQAPQTLLPVDLRAFCHFLPDLHAGITVSNTDDSVQLNYYGLDTGHHYAAVQLDPLHIPISIIDSGADVCILLYDPACDCHVILRWTIPRTPDSNEVYTDTYFSAAQPDSAAIAACRNYASEIGRRHGIQVLIWEDAVAVQPWGYDFEPEHLYRVIMDELSLLDQRLSRYPEGFLAATASHFDRLNVCLVRQITGSAASGTLNAATGIQFFQDNDAYVVIAAGEFSEQALYHELYHVMETHILNNSTALDQWNSLNPSGFTYDYDYSANARRNSGIYLQQEYRAFVDTYSMSFPKEDRARILEYAMLPGQGNLFQTKIMQEKLQALCLGIREAYDLKKAEEVFLWEQYLHKPLAYKK